jgi:hypothetical protein
MEPQAIAAKFAAYCWSLEDRTDDASIDAAMTFARRNWPAFLGEAPAGLGRLLMRVGRNEPRRQRERTRIPRSAQFVAAG